MIHIGMIHTKDKNRENQQFIIIINTYERWIQAKYTYLNQFWSYSSSTKKSHGSW